MTQPLMHPQFVAGRSLWIEPVMQDIIDKIRFGDPVLGWEGDDCLNVFWNDTLKCFELMRWEKGDYSIVARLKSGATFDERIIHELAARDMKRHPDRDLHAEIEAHNDSIDTARQARHDELIAEEVAPRLRRSMIKEGWI